MDCQHHGNLAGHHLDPLGRPGSQALALAHVLETEVLANPGFLRRKSDCGCASEIR